MTFPLRISLISVVLANVCLASAPNAAASEAAVQKAQQLCVTCHGADFSGGKGPALAGGKFVHATSDEAAVQSILKGIPEKGMPPFQGAVSPEEAAALVQYIKGLTPPKPAEATEGPQRPPVQSKLLNLKVERVGFGYKVPWSLAFLPDGRMLVSERVGQLRLIERDGQKDTVITNLPRTRQGLEAGMLSLALHPDYVNNGWIYLSYSDPRNDGTSMTKIVRGKIAGSEWTQQETIWEAESKYYTRGEEHYGCRLRFHDGHLYFTLGERAVRWASQDLTDPRGKVHRLTPEGRAPDDNPFAGVAGALKSIWSYGHRNPQGLFIDAPSGQMWSVEHGPMGGDELNRVRRSENYGWPIVTYGKEHNGDIISDLSEKPGLIGPVKQFTPSIGATSVYVSRSGRYPQWDGHVLVGSLVGQQLRRFHIVDDRIIEEETVLSAVGRIRDITTGPDGYIYLAIEHWGNPGEIVRLVPQE